MIRVRLRLAVLAMAALTGGLVIYLIDRPTTLLTSLGDVLIYSGTTAIPLSANLPSALHVLAFSFLSVAFLPRVPQALVIGVTLALGVVLEVSQALPGPWPVGSGTFDWWDLLASGLAASAALATVKLQMPSTARKRSGIGSRRRAAVMALAAIAATVATSPPPPDAYMSTNLDHLCPGSGITLTWDWMSGSQPPEDLTLVASDPAAISPSFERLDVRPDGSKEVIIYDEVEFYLEGAGGEIFPVRITVIPERGDEQMLWNSAVCSGNVIAWDPVVVSAAHHDARAIVETVSPALESSADLLVGKEGSSVILQAGDSTAVFGGLPFVGSWRIEPADSAQGGVCSNVDPEERLEVAVRVRVVCPAASYP